MTSTLTARAAARQAVIDSVTDRATFEHYGNYRKLHVYRDGEVRWTEHITRTDDIIDDGADHFAAVPSVACVGTGSFACNCDYCDDVYSAIDETNAIEAGHVYDKESKYATKAEAISDAVANGDLTDIEASMLAEFDNIPMGYFADDNAYKISDGYSDTTVEAESIEEAIEAAESWVNDGAWDTSTGTVWITVSITHLTTDETRSVTFTIDPEEPPCIDSDEHDWKSPIKIVGGIKENPGVWGHGGGVIINEVCMRCGCGKTTDTWAQNPENGQQGLTSIKYEPKKYALPEVEDEQES